MNEDQFTKLSKGFDTLSGQVAELNDLTLKLYQHVEERFDAVEKRFDAVEQHFDTIEKSQAELRAELKADINRLYGLVDDDLNRRDTDEQERLAMTSQLDRHKGWIGQLADQTGTKLTPQL